MFRKLISGAAASALLLASCRQGDQFKSDTSPPLPITESSRGSLPVAKADRAASSPPILVRETGHELAHAESVYKSAPAPQHKDLTGVWFQTLHIIARDKPGDPEIIYRVDSTLTIPSADGEERRPGWTLRFPEKNSVKDHFMVDVGGGVDRLNFEFDSSGDLLFAPDFAADNSPTYHCRAATVDRLICYDTQHRQEAFEFRRAPVSPSPGVR